jgi:hypothetical protein
MEQLEEDHSQSWISSRDHITRTIQDATFFHCFLLALLYCRMMEVEYKGWTRANPNFLLKLSACVRIPMASFTKQSTQPVILAIKVRSQTCIQYLASVLCSATTDLYVCSSHMCKQSEKSMRNHQDPTTSQQLQ